MKKILLITFSLVFLFTLAACGNVDDETAEHYINEATDIVTLLNEGNTEEVQTMFDEEMKGNLSEYDLRELSSYIEQSGNFKEIDKSSVEEQDELYTTVLVTNYSEGSRIFTITFNQNDEVTGLFVNE
ncbi:DUF3887 domain-containing protein [Paraliobacillus sp. JSM ZJ581]|uniref:DUF3887 domain-containing protein n=1 Tax=Paraliobacillus sp. JSM ZJ581 TaxID=3342118 RepID=UPI0035A845D2